MPTKHMTALAIGLSVMCAASLVAQTQETKTTTNTKIEIKDGTDVSVIGCLERRPNGDYTLTEVRDNRRVETSKYALVTNEDLSKRLGERVEIRGKAVIDGRGKVSVETKTRTEVENGKDQQTKTKTEGTSGALDMPLLGITSMKTLASTCL